MWGNLLERRFPHAPSKNLNQIHETANPDRLFQSLSGYFVGGGRKLLPANKYSYGNRLVAFVWGIRTNPSFHF
jgi:hypothetical protein